jgi:hypothetical protein
VKPPWAPRGARGAFASQTRRAAPQCQSPRAARAGRAPQQTRSSKPALVYCPCSCRLHLWISNGAPRRDAPARVAWAVTGLGPVFGWWLGAWCGRGRLQALGSFERDGRRGAAAKRRGSGCWGIRGRGCVAACRGREAWEVGTGGTGSTWAGSACTHLAESKTEGAARPLGAGLGGCCEQVGVSRRSGSSGTPAAAGRCRMATR